MLGDLNQISSDAIFIEAIELKGFSWAPHESLLFRLLSCNKYLEILKALSP